MRTASDTRDPAILRRQSEDLWRWTLVDPFGVTIGCGACRDEASAKRHARRCALLHEGELTLRVYQED